MAILVGINGFGRMGRLGFRVGFGWDELEIVHVNDISGDANCAAHLLKYDSVHGRWDKEIGSEKGCLVVEGRQISYSSQPSPHLVDWKGLGVDLVLDCTGVFKTPQLLKPYFDQGIQKVVVSAPIKEKSGNVLNVVMGVNDHLYDPKVHTMITPASCTTNCLAPLIKVILDGIGISHGSITTIHDITNTQTIVDLGHKDLRRARACSQSLIPTSSGSTTAIIQIFPELDGRLDGLAVRVPLLNASLTDCVLEVSRETTVEEVNGLLKTASEGSLKGILGYETLPLVSVDYKDDPRSSVIDALSTLVINKTQVKILAWYDNEWGYANRMMELTRKVALSLS